MDGNLTKGMWLGSRVLSFFKAGGREAERGKAMSAKKTKWANKHFTTTYGAILTTLIVPASVFAQERPYDWGWGMHPMGWMGGVWGIGMMFMMLLFWFLVIAGLILVVRWFLSDQRERRGSDSALEILRQRYARGEINKEEFDAKKRDLS